MMDHVRTLIGCERQFVNLPMPVFSLSDLRLVVPYDASFFGHRTDHADFLHRYTEAAVFASPQ
jgi:hypothetical protein